MTDPHIFDGPAADDEDVSRDDSEILGHKTSGLLIVQETGSTCVVTVNSETLQAEHNIAVYREEIVSLIREHDCKEFVFDLTGIPFMPSGALGLIASIRNMGVRVAVMNPTPQVREVFEVTQLDQIVELRD